MKPRWERIAMQISAENYYSWTGCMNAELIRFLLIKFLLDLFEPHSMEAKGFTHVRLCSGYYHMEAVYEGHIVDLEFYLQIIGAGMPSIWRIMFTAQKSDVLEVLFARVLEYLEKGIDPLPSVPSEEIKRVERDFLFKMDAFLNLDKYKEYVKAQK